MRSMPPLPPEVRTSRLVLRRQHPDDAQMIKDAVDASLAHLQSSVAWAQGAPEPLPILAARLAASAAAFDAGQTWSFSILNLAQTRVLGGAALMPAEDALIALVGPDAVETGYWLRADSTGYGYASEATACLAELAFTHLGARRVVVCHDPSNAASEGVPRRLGFRCIGTVAAARLPGRQAADGSVRPATKVWVLDAPTEC
jgi:RimJ/RimL family protein N-acetyltransferase